MEPDARDQLVATLSAAEQRILAALHNGRATVKAIRPHVGRTDSMTRELDHLRALGLIRRCTSGPRPHPYELVPADEVDAAAAAYQPRKPRRERGLRKPDHRLRPGKQSRWDTFYSRVLDLTYALACVEEEQMLSWECAAPDEIERVRDGLLELRTWCDAVLDMSVTRIEGDRYRDKIEVLLNPNGRTPAEQELAERIANGYAAKLR